MARGTAPLVEGHPAGYPAAFRAGRALTISFFVPGLTNDKLGMQDAVHFKERVRARCIPTGGGKSRPQLYNTERTTAWEAWVGEQALEQLRQVHLPGDQDFTLPIRECRVFASLRFNLRKPSSYPRSVVHMVKKPDADNLCKGLFDGLVKAGVLADDSLITDEYVMKRYADVDHPAGVECSLTAIPLG